MADDSEGIRERLQALYLQAKDMTARTALSAELFRLLYDTPEPSQEARAWLVDMLFELKNPELVDKMAFGDHDEETKRAAGIVHVTNSSRISDWKERKEALMADAKNDKLYPFARNLATLLLVQQWRREKAENQNVDLYREAKGMMDDESCLRGSRLEVAKFLLDYCINQGKAFPVVAEIVTSGKWKELSEEAGKWLIGHLIETKNMGEAKRIVESPNTLEAVKDYAAERFDEIGFRPIPIREEKITMMGMPAFKPEGMRAKIIEVRRVPPSPEQITGRNITLKGPVK